ncbi:MAG: D-alanyl-D-alanine carboxypeptidase [Lewinellaceae bacterium]|nr:D-alanyl-D-alanine carboxypeptidase [Lewinellaceae bacterium]
MKPWLLLLFSGLLLASCAPGRKFGACKRKHLEQEITASPVFAKSVTGFVLMDAATGTELAAVNADRYFTPASNTQILTLATCLKVLGDSLPRFRYVYGEPDSSEPLGFWAVTGTADPTTLHPDFAAWQNNTAFRKTRPSAPLWLLHLPGASSLSPYGPGWMWDDFSAAYSPEISDVPVNGNVIRVDWNGSAWQTYPALFQSALQIDEVDQIEPSREAMGQVIRVPENPGGLISFNVPMYQMRKRLPELLADTLLNMGWDWVFEYDPIYDAAPAERWYACPSDTAYRRMMHQSDNFFAEQLLLLCAGEKFDTLNQNKLIHWMQDSVWMGFPNPPRWADGSGLSRYNLCTPRYFTQVLLKMWQEQSHERLFDLFPAGGIDGTVKDWYAGPDGKPFVFAKSGSMSGVYCLSGYLVAKSGRVLIFPA